MFRNCISLAKPGVYEYSSLIYADSASNTRMIQFVSPMNALTSWKEEEVSNCTRLDLKFSLVR